MAIALTLDDIAHLELEALGLPGPQPHTPVFPVFTERRSDGRPILLAYLCLCGAEIRVDYLGA